VPASISPEVILLLFEPAKGEQAAHNNQERQFRLSLRHEGTLALPLPALQAYLAF
jgi:hypothetical protein